MVAALILAAGASSRFGANKLLLPFDGGTVVSTTVANVLGSSARPVVVVTGHERAQVEQALAGLAALGVDFVHNPDYAAGEMLSSIKVGLSALVCKIGGCRRQRSCSWATSRSSRPGSPTGSSRHMNRRCGDVIAPRYRFDGPRGHPVLIARAVWPDVLALAPEANVRDLLSARAQ